MSEPAVSEQAVAPEEAMLDELEQIAAKTVDISNQPQPAKAKQTELQPELQERMGGASASGKEMIAATGDISNQPQPTEAKQTELAPQEIMGPLRMSLISPSPRLVNPKL